ncbi:MAG: DNA polymerase III subunit delta' [Desulfobacterales bacterium]|nr:MAG: DNA polymerase III subunit delta' [Desulfobacterales bacterium]
MPGFESIIGQDRPKRILSAFLQHGSIPHALLFTGIEGLGKESAAVAFAMACNCAEKSSRFTPEGNDSRTSDHPEIDAWSPLGLPCGACKSCRKIESDYHPDIIRLQPAGSFIKIDQIRALCQTLTMKPYEAKVRVVIIPKAQTMNPAAANALLKVLEEPPFRTVLILIAPHTSDLLPTIVSRCQQIRFNPISRKNLVTALVRQHSVDSKDAQIIATMAGGSLSRAVQMHQTNWINRRNWLICELEAISAGSANRLLAFGDQLAKNKENLPEALEVVKSWLRDLAVAKFYPDNLINHDLTAELQRTSQHATLPSLLSKFEAIQSTQNAIKAGTNVRLAIESMVLKLSRV